MQQPVKSRVAARKRTHAGPSKMAVAARRKAFIEAYITNGGNATQAAITAGFSPKTAYSQGHRLLKHVETQNAVVARWKKIVAAAELDTERTLSELARIAYSEPKEPIRWRHKLKALDMAAKHLGMYDKDNAHKPPIKCNVEIVLVKPPHREELGAPGQPKLLPPPAVEQRQELISPILPAKTRNWPFS